MNLAPIVASLLTVAVLMGSPDQPPKSATDSASFVCELRKKVDTFRVEGKAEHAIFHIRSESGIGGAKITRRVGAWPNPLVLRFEKMSNLESFTAKIGKVQIGASLRPAADEIYFDKDGNQQEKAEGSAFSLQIVQMKAEAGIEVTIGLPATARELDAIELNWIDAFR
jgi:hypothetical protein